MTAIPSFVELMASLGLDSQHSALPAIPQQTDFSSPSLSIVVSEHDTDTDHHSPRLRAARYAPYSAPISHSHRRSSSSLSGDGYDSERSERAASASPCPQGRIIRHRPVALKISADSRHRHATPESEMTNTPISTFVRRKTPQSSPVSPTFAHRTRTTKRRSQSPKFPVLIPTLPPVFLQSQSDEPLSSRHKSGDDIHSTPDYPIEDRRHSLHVEEDRVRLIT